MSTPPQEQWRILLEPVSDNGISEKRKNKGGIGVYLAGAGEYSKREVARVAFERKNSAHPEMSFEDALAETVGKARAAIRILEEQFSWAGEMS